MIGCNVIKFEPTRCSMPKTFFCLVEDFMFNCVNVGYMVISAGCCKRIAPPNFDKLFTLSSINAYQVQSCYNYDHF